MSDAKVLVRATYRSGPQHFRLDLGTDEERLEPAAGVRWRLPAEDLPGGFALGFWRSDDSGVFSISDLHIELKK